MTIDRTLGIGSILRRIERSQPLRHELNEAVYKQLRVMPDRTLTRCTDRITELAHGQPWLWEYAGSLIQEACNNRHRIDTERKLIWMDQLSRGASRNWRAAQDLQQSQSSLIRSGIIADVQRVHGWVDDIMRGRGFKPAALILLSHTSYTHHRALTTKQVCDWLERSVVCYDGDHGVFRFIGILMLRMRYINPGTRLHERAVSSLSLALYQVGRFDQFFIDTMISRWMDKLRPAAQCEVRSIVRAHLLKERRQLFRIASNLKAPATP